MLLKVDDTFCEVFYQSEAPALKMIIKSACQSVERFTESFLS